MRIVAVAVGLAGVLSMPGPLARGEGASRPAPGTGTPREFSDENVRAAIEKGAAYLWSLQKPDGSFPEFAEYPDGPTALIAWALLESGVKPSDKRMEKALKWLEAVKSTKGYVPKTYCMGLRCQAWLAAIRYKGDYRAALRRDAELLVKTGRAGTFHYSAAGFPEASWDNSCTYYGHLGIWAPASVNLEIPAAYWKKSLAHWITTQCADGGWAYTGAGARGTAPMTAAGVAGMYVCFDALFGEAYAGCGAPRAGAAAQASIDRGLAWLDRNFAGTLDAVDGYYLQGVEQVGLTSGRKHFGAVDWYKAGARLLLRNQEANGSWAGGLGGPPVTTAQCMLFLIHGRTPVMFGRLQYAGDWNNRPRALAMLARWMSRDILCGGDVSWQIVSVKTAPSEWHDAPVLCITGTKKPAFTDEELARLRTYVGQGGTILSVAECDGEGFDKGMKEIYAGLFPEYAIREAPPTHELYRVHQDLGNSGVVFQVVSNGVRPLAIHVSKDLPRAWQRYSVRQEKWAFQAASNIYLYAADRTLPARGTRTWPAASSVATTYTVKLARVKFAGNWNPEPLAYERFSRLLQERAKVKLEVSPVEAARLAASGAQVAVLSGTGELKFGEPERQSLRSFVDAGGTLVIDAAGGDKAFADSAAAMVRQAFGAGATKRVAMTDPLMTVAKIEAVRYRRRTDARMRGEEFSLTASPVGAGTGRVIFSSLDITAALVGSPCLACDGYDPETAYEILRNVVLSKIARR